MQHSITDLFPKGSSGLNAPMRLERPAARRIAATGDIEKFSHAAAQRRSVFRRAVAPLREKASLILRIQLQIAQCAERVLPRHLLAPLVDKVCVVEWPSFDVSGFSRRLDLLVCEWPSDQRSRGFFDLNWRRCDTAEDDASVSDRNVVSLDPRRDTEHRKIEGATTTQFLI